MIIPEFPYLDSEELHDALVVILVCVDGDEQELALVLLSDVLGNLDLNK